MKSIVVIPARLASTRLPNKLLLDKTGKPLLIHTIEEAKRYFDVVVATQDQEIHDVVGDHARVIMTGQCSSGTERVYETCLDELSDYDIIINWQADEPELDGQYVLDMAEMVACYPKIDIVTLFAPATKEEYLSPSVVKAVLDHGSFAMYFSRCSIPYNGPQHALKHIGIYAFRREALLATAMLGHTTYPTESLEQLQWLQAGLRMKACVRSIAYAGIDTQEEYDAFVKRHVI